MSDGGGLFYGAPTESYDFVGKGGATERVSFSLKSGNEQSGVCDDEPPLFLFGGNYEKSKYH